MTQVLLPNWPQDAQWQGIFGRLPGDAQIEAWKPRLKLIERLDQVEARAFPTPLAWAKLMELVLTERLSDHLLFQMYRKLVLGLTLGYLDLEIVDLRVLGADKTLAGKEAPGIGHVIVETDPAYRFLGLLRGTSKHENLHGKLFGATSPATLFWPSSRLEGGDWDRLESAVKQDRAHSVAFHLLADFRDVVREAGEGKWEPPHIPWMWALDTIIGEQEPRANRELYNIHARTLGPILADFVGGREPVYVPTLSRSFSIHFLESLTGTCSFKDGRVQVVDERGTAQFDIAAPTPPNGDPLLAGAGTIQSRGAIPPTGLRQPLNLSGDKGLFAQLQPLFKTAGNDAQKIRQTSYSQPDVIRILATRLGDAGLPGTNVSFGKHALGLVFNPGLQGLPSVAEIESGQGFVLSQTDQNRVEHKFLYVEDYAGVTVGDLRALGAVLWRLFNGDGRIEKGKIKAEDGEELLEPNSLAIYASDALYEDVAADNAKRDRFRKLATLQRFVASYAQDQGKNQVDQLCQSAVATFARWAWGSHVIANGVPSTSSDDFNVSGLQLRFWKDPL